MNIKQRREQEQRRQRQKARRREQIESPRKRVDALPRVERRYGKKQNESPHRRVDALPRAKRRNRPGKASDYSEHKNRPGKASDYMVCLDTLLYTDPSSREFVLYCRESSHTQVCNGNLNEHDSFWRREIPGWEVTIRNPPGSCLEVGPGWSNNRQKLLESVDYAKKYNVPLLAESACRFFRSMSFHPYKNPDAQPTVEEFEEFKRLTKGVRLVTILHPDLPWKIVRHFETMRGRQAKGKKGGRPPKRKPGYKKTIREEKKPQVQELSRTGHSQREIEKLTGVSRTTVRRWLNMTK
jgi:hypothetical protein